MTDIKLSLWSVIFLFGAIHGFALAIYTLLKKNRRVDTIILALLVFVIALLLSDYTLRLSDLYQKWPQLTSFSFPLWFLIGPLFYLYFKTYLEESFKYSHYYLLNFIPFIFVIWNFIPFYSLDNNIKLSVFEASQKSGNISTFYIFLLVLYMLQTLAYAIIAIRLIRYHERSIKDCSSDTNVTRLEWLKKLMIVFSIYLVTDFVSTINFIIFAGKIGSVEYISANIISLFVYLIGYTSVRYPERINTEFMISRKKYEKASLDKNEISLHLKKLYSCMDYEKLYLKSSLTLTDLSTKMNVSPQKLSQIINQELDVTFYDFVNSYRLKEARLRLHDPQYKNLNILAVAYDVGFNSSTSFYRIFKKSVGMTPTKYIKEQQAG